MTDKLFDSLEICLQALERGETIDSALKRFPALADELRPILEVSLHAKSLAGEAIVEEIHRRGRARVLQRAAELREAKRAPRRRTWIFAFRPVAVTLFAVVFLLSGTGLVRASSTSLPGDNLYPVKRTWEDFTLIFVEGLEHDDLELTYETERVEEVNELLAVGRNEVVTFSGYVTSQTQSQWTVAGVPVLITADTSMPAEPVGLGAGVTISGQTNELGFLVAQSVVPVDPGTVIPEIDVEEGEDEDEDENKSGLENLFENDDSANPSDDDAEESEDELRQPESKLEGVLESTNGKLWIVNGKNVDVSGAVIFGTPAAGAEVVIEGFYNANGVFIATRVTFSNSGSADSNESSSDGRDSDGNDDDGDDDDNSNNDNDNDSDDGDNNNNDSGDNENGDDD